jgi:hypothetical protein
MKRSTFLAIAALVGIIFGLAMALMPQKILEQNGLTSGANEPILARALAACIISVSLGIWVARNSAPSSALTGMLWLIALIHFSSFAVDLYYYSQHYLNSGVFGGGVLHVLLGAGALYYLARMESEPSSSADAAPSPV